MKEVRWHARAGQGAKTVSQLLAEAGLLAGSSVQAFPEYGPERRGAPMRAYTRISEKTIRRHDPVASPDIVIVLEPTLVNEMNVAEGLSPRRRRTGRQRRAAGRARRRQRARHSGSANRP